MPKKLTYEEVKNFIEVESGSGCKLLSEDYINSKYKLSIRCRCGEIFNISYNQFQRDKKYFCNDCGYKITGLKLRKSQSDWLNDIQKYSDEYLFMEDYKKALKKIKVKHLTCGYVYKVRPNDFLNGYRCPNCGGTKKKTDTEFKCELKNKYNGEFESLEPYITIDKPILFKHRCGKTFKTTPYSLLSGNCGCPKCNSSKGEKFISEYLDELHLEYISQARLINSNKYLRYDYEVNKVCIEYDGKQHFVPYFKLSVENGMKQLMVTQANDKIKNQYCINNNMPLIRIPYWEENNIEYILENVLAYFNIHKLNNNIDKEIVERYLVDSHWNHDTYLSWQHRENRYWLNRGDVIEEQIHI